MQIVSIENISTEYKHIYNCIYVLEAGPIITPEDIVSRSSKFSFIDSRYHKFLYYVTWTSATEAETSPTLTTAGARLSTLI